MSKQIRVVYEEEPRFPAVDQHPDAKRYVVEVDDRNLFVDAVGYTDEEPPTAEDVQAILSGRLP